MSDHDHRGAELALQAAHLGPHGLAQAGVQVADRLIEKVEVRLLNDGAADRHALLLTAADLLHVSIEELLDAKQTGDLHDPAVGFFARNAADLEGIGKILADRKMRIERVALEHHADMTVARRQA